MFTQVTRRALVHLPLTVSLLVSMEVANPLVVSSQQITTTAVGQAATSGHDTMRSEIVRGRFDGHWWNKADSDERSGFLYALDDCLTYDLQPPLQFEDTWSHYEQRISQYYASASANLRVPVQSVFQGFGKRADALRKPSVGERYGNEFWRAHTESARRGFLEGYISCRTPDKHRSKWTKPLEFYLQRLDDMYNVDDRHGEDAEEYTGSVADALQKLSKSQ